MDNRLFQAAITGNVGDLLKLLEGDPLMLHEVELSSGETPLHVAAMAGQLNFVKEIIRLKPEFAGELNQTGFCPIHIASANGYLEIVKELLKVNTNCCRLTSRGKRTALHYAAIKGQIDVIKELILSCAESVEDVTVRNETALHLAVQNNQFEAMRVLVETLVQLKKENILNMMDAQGNTVLHSATSTKQQEVVNLLVGEVKFSAGVIEVNAMNKSSLTALDLLLLFPSEAGDREIEELLRGAGGMRGCEVNSQLETQHTQSLANNTSESSQSPLVRLVEYFKFQRGRDSPSDARSAILVIAVLIATATYQAGLSPPGGVWQDSNNSTNSTMPRHIEGKAILGSRNGVSFGLFLFFNSFGFHLSLFMIQILTHGFPLRIELQTCMLALVFTYNISIASIAPGGPFSITFHVFSAIFPLLIPFIAKWIRQLLQNRKSAPSVSNRTSLWFGRCC